MLHYWGWLPKHHLFWTNCLWKINKYDDDDILSVNIWKIMMFLSGAGGGGVGDEAKNEPFLGGHFRPDSNLFDQIMP